MCRLFGLSAGAEPVTATFWLLEAPDSLRAQSHREPDGTGLGYFDHQGRPHLDKQPLAAFRDRAFAREARTVASPTVVIASEVMDADPGWRALGSGELIHVTPALETVSTTLIDEPPARLLRLEDLAGHARESQA